MNLLERAKSMANGVAVLAEWTVDGNVIDPEQAQKRADVCTGRLSGNTCPNNVPDWPLTESISGAIRRIAELRNRMELRVQGNKSLNFCSACGCPLKSKVWLELKRILPDEEERRKLDARCWILSELKANQ